MNLIICCTPLQILIAEKIIELHPNERFHGLVITPILSNKYQYYFDKLSKICQKIDLIVTNNYSKFLIYFNVIKVKFLFHNSFEKIFIANINDSIIQAIVSKFNKSLLYTFDDGTINIKKNNFGTSKFENTIKKIFRVLLNFHEDIDSLKEKSCLHYTIYPNIQNIIANVQTIKLFEQQEISKIDESDPIIKIMLGQPVFDKNSVKNKEIINKVIQSFDIDYYFPHPRENYVIDHVQYIDTDLIFEDYFQKNLSNYHVKLFTFFSSSALNLYHIKNIDIVSIYDKSIQNRDYLEIYDLFQNLNITMIEI